MSSMNDLMELENVIEPQKLEELARSEPMDAITGQRIQQLTMEKIRAAQHTQSVQMETKTSAERKIKTQRRGRRILAALAACALIISLGTAAVARFSTDERLLEVFHADSQSQIAQLNEMSVQIGQSCQADGYTVTLQQAISDRHNSWVLMEVEGPAEAVLDEDLVYFQDTHIQMEKLSGHGYTIYPLPDAVPGDNKLSYILDFSARNQLAGQKLQLQLGRLTENIVDETQSLIGFNLLAEGPWTFELEVPKQDSTVSMWQWRLLRSGETDFLLCRVDVSPLSASLETIKLERSIYMRLQKEPLQVYLQDGTCLEFTCSSSGSGGVRMQYQYEFSVPVQLNEIVRIVYCGQELNW